MSEEQRPGRRGALPAEDILTAAVALVDTEGISQLTMRRLGAAICVKVMTLYRYFPSRRALLDALVESVVGGVATDPAMQLLPDDDWRDYLDRLAHGIRRSALTHPRVFPLVATHPPEAPWIRPPIRSLRWVESFLSGMHDHHFPPPAAVTVYKQFSTFLLGHLLLEVSALGLDHPDTAVAPPPPPDRNKRIAEQTLQDDAAPADTVMDADQTPSAVEIMDAATTRADVAANEPALQAADRAAAATAALDADGPVEAVLVDADIPVDAAVVSTATINLEDSRTSLCWPACSPRTPPESTSSGALTTYWMTSPAIADPDRSDPTSESRSLLTK
ncbi:MAG: TetR/AcrR family transcriptional regulator [Actinomycetota bacterium]|nr:TetR/AcrR family transcriptional regulator [Actinomycetota bacterium]